MKGLRIKASLPLPFSHMKVLVNVNVPEEIDGGRRHVSSAAPPLDRERSRLRARARLRRKTTLTIHQVGRLSGSL